MDENKTTGPLPEIPDEEFLTEPQVQEEIQAAEAAMEAAGLTHPGNADTDRIIEEARDLSVTDSIPEIPQEPAPQTQVYADAPEEDPYDDEEEEDESAGYPGHVLHGGQRPL